MTGFDHNAIPDGRTREGRAMRESMKHQGGDLSNDAAATSLTRAEARIREIRGTMPDGGETRDKFWAPSPPDGFDYQWKRKSVYNQEDPAYQVELTRQGWEPVPLSRHSEMMPKGWNAQTIEVEGMTLMERPMIFTNEARMREDRAAREAVMTKEAQLRSSRKGDLGNREVLAFNKSREAIAIPDGE
jgi:hypothetical protein